jgi:hypothetical protein
MFVRQGLIFAIEYYEEGSLFIASLALQKRKSGRGDSEAAEAAGRTLPASESNVPSCPCHDRGYMKPHRRGKQSEGEALKKTV